ncbi:hypothetical protein HK098_002373 [Nowakowskiella sp. JEL0407]|nr:hypothetical protein HK098_002373 [Nowakowskiella sp. JEL0407]
MAKFKDSIAEIPYEEIESVIFPQLRPFKWIRNFVSESPNCVTSDGDGIPFHMSFSPGSTSDEDVAIIVHYLQNNELDLDYTETLVINKWLKDWNKTGGEVLEKAMSNLFKKMELSPLQYGMMSLMGRTTKDPRTYAFASFCKDYYKVERILFPFTVMPLQRCLEGDLVVVYRYDQILSKIVRKLSWDKINLLAYRLQATKLNDEKDGDEWFMDTFTQACKMMESNLVEPRLHLVCDAYRISGGALSDSDMERLAAAVTKTSDTFLKRDLLQSFPFHFFVSPQHIFNDRYEWVPFLLPNDTPDSYVKPNIPQFEVGRMYCFSCGVSFCELKHCGRCLEASYCSVDCQRKDWKTHKNRCKELAVIEKNSADQPGK